MAKLTPEQETVLAQLSTADIHYRDARVHEYNIARTQADERILAFRIERDKIAAQARRLEVPVLQIAQRGLHTSDTKTARVAIAHGEGFLPADEDAPAFELETPAAGPFEATERGVLVTLTAEDFQRHGIDSGEDSYEFESNYGRIFPVNADADETWMHPVVRLVMGENDSWRTRLAEFTEAAAA
jgi:hypothetical protein